MIRILVITISLALLGSSCSSVKKSTRKLRAQHESQVNARIDSSASSKIDSGKLVRTDSGSVKTETKTDENKIIVTLDPDSGDSVGGEIVYYPAWKTDPKDYLSPDPKPVKIKVPKNTKTVEIQDRRHETKKDSSFWIKADSSFFSDLVIINKSKTETKEEKSIEESSSKSVRRTAILSGIGAVFLVVLLFLWYWKRKQEKKSLL
jgi:hypothetical protein